MSCKKSRFCYKLMKLLKKKSLLLTFIEKDIKRSDELLVQAKAEKGFSILRMSNCLKEHVKQKRR